MTIYELSLPRQDKCVQIVNVRVDRLAGSVSACGVGIGELLLQNAIRRALQALSTLGVHAVVVEAKDNKAEAFYRKYGIRRCNSKSRQSYLPLGDG